jgi:hypothetical protein
VWTSAEDNDEGDDQDISPKMEEKKNFSRAVSFVNVENNARDDGR